MGAGITAATNTKPRPDIAIVMTDGYTPWPTAPPPFKTIIIYTTTGMETGPKWAINITMGEGDK